MHSGADNTSGKYHGDDNLYMEEEGMTNFERGLIIGATVGVAVLGLCIIIAIELSNYNIIIVR